MQGQVRLRWLLRRACLPGVLASNQVGMTVHALRQLDLLDVSLNSPALSPLPVVRQLCGGADARSKANLLHALASAVSENCSHRTVMEEELYTTVQCVQSELVEVADTLTATETVLVMEALLKLMPYVGSNAGAPLVNSRLVEEVRERTMALASVVERPVDLLGVTRVIVEAISVTSAVTREAAHGDVQSAGSFAWASFSLENVLRVVQARLRTFSKQELISLVDVLTVRLPSTSHVNLRPALPSSSSVLLTSLRREGNCLAGDLSEDAELRAESTPAAADGVTLLDASRPLIPEVMDSALATVPSLTTSQLCAWLTRLTALRLTDNALLLAVVQSLSSIDVNYFTVSQLASGAKALSELLSLTSVPGQPWAHAELCLHLYARLLHGLSSVLYNAERGDPAVLHHARTRLLPLLSTIPEDALDEFVNSAMPKEMGNAEATVDVQMKSKGPVTMSRPHVLSVCAKLASAIEKAASVLLRFIAELPPREQALLAASLFYWRVYVPCIANVSDVLTSTVSSALPTPSGQDDRFVFKSRDVLQRSFPLSLSDTARKHRAFCGLIIAHSAGFTARDCVLVLNELVMAHYADSALQLRCPQEQHLQSVHAFSAADSSHVQSALSDARTSAVRLASQERQVLMKLLNDHLQGPLQRGLAEVHTAQLVRYLSSLSRMGVGAKSSYVAVLGHLKGRPLSSVEQVSVLAVVARHHLKCRHVLHGVVRALPDLGTTLSTSAKISLIKSLGQANGQRLVTAPCDAALTPATFFPSPDELKRLTFLQLIFGFNGLIELRQYENPALQAVLAELNKRIHTPLHSRSDCFRTINSATSLAEFFASLCRFGGPAEGVSVTLLLETMRTLEQRLATSRSLFVDLARLNWYWPSLQEYFNFSSVLWTGCESSMHHAKKSTVSSRAKQWAFTAEESHHLAHGFSKLREAAGVHVAARLKNIAESPTLRPNTFLWGQMVCGLRFGGLPPRGSLEKERLVANLEKKKLLPLLNHPQQLLDVAVLALHLALEGRDLEAVPALRWVERRMAAMRVQDCLQVWWYTSQLLAVSTPGSTAPPAARISPDPRRDVDRTDRKDTGPPLTATSVSEGARLVLQAVRDAAKEQVLGEEKAVMQKLSVMEKRLLESLH